MTDTTDMVSENIESAGETIVAISEGNREDEFEGGEFQIAKDNDVELTFESSGGSSFDLSEEEVEELEEEEQTPSKPQTATSTTNTNPPSSRNNGSYMIIAGSYREKYNAEKMIQKLERLGFNNAKVIVFENSNIYAAIAGYYNSSTAAKEAKNSLVGSGVDCYVKRRG